jgi:hypothetical protein
MPRSDFPTPTPTPPRKGEGARAFEGDSHVEWFEGNFADYEEDTKRRLGIDSTIPHRIKYKKFSR